MRNSQLHKYASSSELMNMRIKYGKDTIKFNLFEELSIDENIINKEVKLQTQSSAFLSILYKKMLRLLKDRQIELDKKKAQVWVKGKNSQIGGRVPTKEDLKCIVDSDPKVLVLSKKIAELQHNCDLLETCVKAFESRSHMLQTISANTRRKS